MERYEGFERWMPTSSGPAADVPGLDPTVSAQWLSALYHSPVLFSGLLDQDGRVVDGNWLSIEGCGFVRREIIGRRFWECGWWSPDAAVASKVRQWCETTLTTADSLSVVSRYFRADGSRGMVELGLVPIIDARPDGNEVSHIVATGLDISDLLGEQAMREDRLAADATISRRAEERFRAGLDAMIDNVTIARSVRSDDGAIVDFEIEFANRVSADGAGRSASELIGRRVMELYPSWRESGLFATFVRVVESGRPYLGERLAYQDVLADGTTIRGHWDVQVAKLDDGYIAASRDVSAMVRNEEAARSAAISAARERLAIDILQDAALSVDLPEIAGVRLGVHYQPAERAVPVGGDWYDAVALEDGRLVLIIADVAGHGPASAGFMVQLRNVLRTVAIEQATPADVLQHANKVVVTLRNTKGSFATCCVATLTPSTGMLEWSLAGHPPPLLTASDGSDRFLTSVPGPPLGVFPAPQYSAGHAHLCVGDRLVLYTDGLIETRRAVLDVDMARLLAASRTSRGRDPADAAAWLAAHVSSGDDDVALIVMDTTERGDAVTPR